MKRVIILLLGLTFAIVACNKKKEAKDENPNEKEIKNIAQTTDKDLSVMTYNIRLDVASDGENAWSNRKEFLSNQVLFLEPDVLGVQEARPNQMNDLNNALKGYKSIGIGRDGGDKGEYSALFYNAKKLKVEHDSTFWLSATPNKISKGWDAAYPRICTYGLFTLLDSKEKVWIFNTHLDHVGTQAQKESMKLILSTIQDVNTKNFPVLIMGDFNVEPDSEVIASTKATMLDTKETAALTFGSNGTFNGFNYHEPVTRRIDYILLSKASPIKVKKYAVLSSAIDFKFPSDHFPVYVELMIQ
ncbi:endonuclease/exonuclease/phosphatase family protein [Lacinutrix chionoecetis]